MKKNLTIFLFLFIGLMAFGFCPTLGLAQQSSESIGKVSRVRDPLGALQYELLQRQRDHHIGFLKPIKRYGKISSLTGLGLNVFPLKTGSMGKSTSTRILRAADGTELWGVLINRSSWSNVEEYERPYGVYSFSTSSDSVSSLHTDNYYMNFNGGAVFYNNVLHGTNYYEYDGTLYYVYSYEFDTDTWEQNGDGVYSSEDFSIIAYATAWDPTSGKVYAFNRDNDGATTDFSILDYSVPTATKIASAERTYVALAINAQGAAYAIGLDGNLYTVDKSTGAAALVGATGVTPAEVLQSAAFDMKTGTLYWAAINANNTSSLYTVDLSTGTATKALDFKDGEEFVALFVPTVANPETPSSATNLTANFDEGKLSGRVDFDIPSTNIAGGELKGSVDYVVIADETDTLAKGKSDAGQHVSTAVVMKNAGKHTIAVVLGNEAGKSKATKMETEWIGTDEPYVVEDVTCKIDTLTGETQLSWPAVTKGWNDGYVNPNEITYTIKDFYTEDVLVENLKDTFFTFNLQKGDYRPYRFTVQSFYNGVPSEWGTSCNPVKWGLPLSVPYTNQLNSYLNYDILDFVDANHDGSYFKFSGAGLSLQNFRRSSNFDDWAVLPPLKLDTGRLYTLSFEVSNRSFSDESNGSVQLEAGYGADLNVSHYSRFLAPTSISPDGVSRRMQAILRVDRYGVYRMGIHILSENLNEDEQHNIVVGNLQLTAGPLLAAPDSVNNVKLLADATGLHQVTVTCNAPVKALDGTALTSLSKVEVYRGDTLVHTFEAPEPGTQLSFEDKGMDAGIVSYRFVPYNASGEGMASSASVTVGVDIPAAPENVAVSDNLDGSAVMTWDAPSIGRNGRVINSDELTYNIYSADESKLAEGLTDREFAFSGIPTDGDQYATGLLVSAQNEAGEGDKTLGVVFAGKPYTLPFHESFANGNPTYSTWVGRTSQSFSLFTSMAQDGDQGCIAFTGKVGEPAIITSGKISLSGVDSPKLSFYYWAVPHAKCEIKVLIGMNGVAHPDTAATFSLRDGDSGWQKAMVDLTPYKTDDGYITLQFFGRSWDPSVPPIIDNITIGEVRNNDLAVELNAPARVNVGADAQFQVKVSNEGNNAAEGALLKLFIDDSLVAQKSIDVPAAKAIYTHLNYVVPAGLPDKVAAKATLEWSPDEDNTNNVSSTDSVRIIRQDLPAVELEGGLDGNGHVKLLWKAPADTSYTYHESFENYEPFSISNIGNWTLHDEDSAAVNAIGGTYYENMFKPCAYMVFNPKMAYLNLEATPQFAPHSGDQYMAAFTCGAEADNYDWLVSPELSGKAQTVTFYCRSVSSESGLETYNVEYSTTGTDVDNFIPLIEDEEASADDWQEVNVDLPEGAKYFAIVCTSSNQFLFMVDDVTYQGKPIMVTGYRVYRDGQPIATLDASAREFTDVTTDHHSHAYNLTLLAAQGESDYSNTVTLIPDAIRSIKSEGVIERYNMEGQRIDGHRSGVQIIRAKDGRIYKVLKK